MRVIYSRIAFLLIALLSAGYTQAQVNEDWVEESDIEDAKLVIEKQKVLTLPRASRAFGRMQLRDKKNTGNTQQNYTLQLLQYPLPPIEPSIRMMPDEPDPLPDLFRGYVRAGFGNYLSPYLQAYYGSARSSKHSYGIGLQHFSAINGPVDQDFSGAGRSAALLHGKLIGKQQTLEGKAEYIRRNTHYYGYTNTPSDKEGIEQIYQEIDFQALWKRMAAKRSPLSFQVGLAGNYFFDNYDASEIEAELDAQVNYELGKQSKARLDIAPLLNIREYADGSTQNRSILKGALGWHFQGKRVQARVGAKVAYNLDTATNLNSFTVYPDAYVQYEAVPAKLFLRLYAQGDLQQRSLRRLTLENPFLNTNQTLAHTHQQLDAGLAIDIAPSEKVGIGIFGGYDLSENRIFMVNSPTDPSQFLLAYEPELTGALKAGAKLALNIGRVKASLGSTYFNYSLDQLAEAYHLPTLENRLSISYTHPEKLKITLEGFQWSGITALDEQGSNITLDPIIDLNLRADYELSDQFGLFLQLKNLASQDYQRYYRYPVRGIQILGGASFLF